MKFKIKLLFIINTLFILKSFAQPTVAITDDDWVDGSSNGACACSTDFSDGSNANFFDSGSNSSDYSPNENEVITLCPDATGTKMVSAFGINSGYTLNIHPSDTLYVYDGPSINDPLLAKVNDTTYPTGTTIQASWSNLSGCLTFQFISDASQEGTGWDANLSCGGSPWQPFSNHITAFVNGTSNGANDTINDMFPLDTGYVDVCLGDVITFNAEPYFPYEPGGDSAALSGAGYMQSTNFNATWEISDGSTYNTSSFQFTPTARNGYYITLEVEDPLGQVNYSFCKVRVSTTPNFSTCGPVDYPICLGRSYEIVGGVSNFDTAGVDAVSTNFPIGGIFGAQTYLPDGSGNSYNTDIAISGFTPGATVQNSSDIDQMCFKIEHSYLGDLEMKLTCPNGQNVCIFNSYSGTGLYPPGFGGGNDFLGGAYDMNIGTIGYCEEYCFSTSSSAMPAWVNGYSTSAATGPTSGNMVVPGLYQPEIDFVPALQGCPINGTWTLTVQDNLSIDDGFICEWGIYFNASLHPANENYSPDIVSDYWVSDSTIIADLDTVIVVQPEVLGPSPYTFVVEDEYGCIYDTTIYIVTLQGANSINDTSTCGNIFQYDTILTPLGGSWFYVSDSGDLFFDDSLSISPLITSSQPGLYTVGVNDNYCDDTLYHIVEFLDIPETFSSIEDTVCFGEDYQFIVANKNPAFSYEWFDSNGDILGVGDSVIVNSTNFDIGLNDDIVLNVSNECGDQDSYINMFIETCKNPNIITPGGSDGVNDVFYTHYAVINDDLKFVVYNRWGKKVFEMDNYDNTWNGVDDNGKPLSSGTYIYILTYSNGNKNTQGFVEVVNSSN